MMGARWAALGVVWALLLMGRPAWACLWDSDTVRDELQTNATDFDLIVGQFPSHSGAYYEARLAATKETPSTVELRDDRAVALVRLGRFEEARKVLDALEADDGKRYETLSNLGVLFKKMKQYDRAADYTKRALAIKPAGHLGLGDYYLKALTWQAAHASEGAKPPEKTFVGYAYADGGRFGPPLEGVDAASIRKLIRADRHFADGMLVFGDVLMGERHLNLALWAYFRAAELGHPRKTAIRERIDSILRHWQEAADLTQDVQTYDEVAAAIGPALSRGEAWLERFHAVEAELVKKGAVDFAAVEAELGKRDVERWRPEPVGLVSKVEALTTVRESRRLQLLLAGLLVAIAIGGALLWKRRRTAKARA